MTDKLYGKYRGMVLNNVDPEQRGRLQVQVPDVTGLLPSTWSMPCAPIAGLQSGMFALPVIGSGVWVEFEQGNPEYPIWVGCFWGSAAEVPAMALLTPPVTPASFRKSSVTWPPLTPMPINAPGLPFLLGSAKRR